MLALEELEKNTSAFRYGIVFLEILILQWGCMVSS